jgi:hypothetical protein
VSESPYVEGLLPDVRVNVAVVTFCTTRFTTPPLVVM